MALIFEVKVNPSSGKQKIDRDKSGIIKCHLKSPPEGGKANAELIKFLSTLLRIPQNQISIITGATSRKKKLRIDAALTLDQLYAHLGIEQQLSITKLK